VPDNSEKDGRAARLWRRVKVDWVSAVMAVVTIAAMVGAGWMYSRSSSVKSVAIGDATPLVQLIDLATSEPLVVLGLKGKVVWIVFWSAGATDAPKTLTALARVSSVLKPHPRFAMLTAAIEVDQPDKVRAVITATKVDLPVYLATPESRLRFGADTADPPLHVLINAEGQIIAIGRGSGQSTINRFAEQAVHLLDQLDPEDNTRFAYQSTEHAEF